jgi:hypothetical protein
MPVDYEGAKVIVGLNPSPDRRRHSVTVRREADAGPNQVHLQAYGMYEVNDADIGSEPGGANK